MKAILTSIGMYIIKQTWFQESLIKMIIDLVKKRAATSLYPEQDILFRVLKRNKKELLIIAAREAKLTETPIDDLLVQTFKNI